MDVVQRDAHGCEHGNGHQFAPGFKDLLSAIDFAAFKCVPASGELRGRIYTDAGIAGDLPNSARVGISPGARSGFVSFNACAWNRFLVFVNHGTLS